LGNLQGGKKMATGKKEKIRNSESEKLSAPPIVLGKMMKMRSDEDEKR